MEKHLSRTEEVDEDRWRKQRGRVSLGVERRDELLDEYERSGLSRAAFARRTGVKYPTFVYWVRERRRKAAGKPEGTKAVGPRFVELGVPRRLTPPEGTLRVALPDGVVVSGADLRAVAGLVKLLRLKAD